ncbi:hypothetical protein K435DRAFT_773870 [Dendrothele bispora CBS 962.96]|uniref:Uncharacterized protein n=1 Tax=Dendrothele bispora (strain CBS 962.96) TaxID=1314807 RepID=A0A4S8MQW1_DENBC|nr:hypothetical protein K435DRAFT_773870 [Dendrothele bispora CBS 962.96]
MFRGLSSHYTFAALPAGDAFQLRHNLSHLLTRYPNDPHSGKSLQIHDRTCEPRVAERDRARTGLGHTEASGLDALSSSHNEVLMPHADHQLCIPIATASGADAGPSHSETTERHKERSVHDNDEVVMVDVIDLMDTSEEEPLFGEDFNESDSEEEEDSNKSESLLSGDPEESTHSFASFLPFQQIQNASLKASAHTLQSDQSSSSSSKIATSPPSSKISTSPPSSPTSSINHPSSPNVPFSFIMTSKKSSPKKRSAKKTHPTHKYHTLKPTSGIHRVSLKKSRLTRTYPANAPVFEDPQPPPKYLNPDLPIDKVTVVHWKNILTSAAYLLEKGDHDIHDARNLSAVLETIHRLKNDVSLEQVKELASAIKMFKHKTDYDEMYDVSIRKRTRDILDVWGRKFLGRGLRPNKG